MGYICAIVPLNITTNYSIKEGIVNYNSFLYREKERERGATKANEGSIKTTNSYSPSKVSKEWRNIPFNVENSL